MHASVSCQGSSSFGASSFGQSGLPTFASTTPTSSPPKRNAFGALIDPGATPFGQPASTQAPTSAFGAPSQPTAVSSRFQVGPGSVSAFASPTALRLNPAAPTVTLGSSFAKPASSGLYQAPPSTSISPFGITSSFSATSPCSTLPQPAKDSVTPKTMFGPSDVGTSQVQVPRSAFVPPQPDDSMQRVSISASAREGGHVPTTRLRPKHRRRWPTPGQLLSPAPIRSAPDVPPYRVPPSIQREIDQGKYATDTRFPGNRFLEVKWCCCSVSSIHTDTMCSAVKGAPPVDARTLDQAQTHLGPGSSHGPYGRHHGRRHLYGYVP